MTTKTKINIAVWAIIVLFAIISGFFAKFDGTDNWLMYLQIGNIVLLNLAKKYILKRMNLS